MNSFLSIKCPLNTAFKVTPIARQDMPIPVGQYPQS